MTFRAQIFRRDDGTFEFYVEKYFHAFIDEEGDEHPAYWSPSNRGHTIADSLQRAQTLLTEDRRTRPEKPKRVFVIDGAAFETLDQFYDEVSTKLLPGISWGHNLDALNDILRGGFGTPEDGFVLRWISSDRSRKDLGDDLFDVLVDILDSHQSEDLVDLELR